MYVVDVIRGTPDPLIITCNGSLPTSSWVLEGVREIPVEPTRLIPDFDTLWSADVEILRIQNLSPAVEGTYHCAGDTLRIFLSYDGRLQHAINVKYNYCCPG